MPTTAARGFRYPAATDRVADGATAMQNLAQDVDDYLTNPRDRAHVYLNTPFTAPSVSYTYAVPLTASAGPALTGFTIASTSRLVVAKTGVYRVSIASRITYPTGTAPAANANGCSAVLFKNGGATALLAAYGAPAASASYGVGSRLLSLTAGDYLELKLTSAAAGTATFEAGEGVTFISAELV